MGKALSGEPSFTWTGLVSSSVTLLSDHYIRGLFCYRTKLKVVFSCFGTGEYSVKPPQPIGNNQPFVHVSTGFEPTLQRYIASGWYGDKAGY